MPRANEQVDVWDLGITRLAAHRECPEMGRSSTAELSAVEIHKTAGLVVLDLRESAQLDAEKLNYLQRYAETCMRTEIEAMKVVNDTPRREKDQN